MLFGSKKGDGEVRSGKNIPAGTRETLPILPVKGTILFPDVILPILVGKESSKSLLKQVLDKDKMIGVVSVKNDETDKDPIAPSDCYYIGAMANILKVVKLPDGNLNVILRGVSRIRVVEFKQTEPYLVAEVEAVEEIESGGPQIEALCENLKRLTSDAIKLIPNIPDEVEIIVSNIEKPGFLADIIITNINIPVEEKQKVLEELDIHTRLKTVTKILTKKIEILKMEAKIQSEVKSTIDENQREYILREQLKAIQKELGEKDERTAEIDELREAVTQKGMPEEAEKVALKELDRLARMPHHAAEYTVTRTYIDWILDLPWSDCTVDNLDIKDAAKVLDEDHYDLEKVKKRVLEYLSVRKLKEDMKGPILCFVGPPGVGKTSLGRSIARAMGREFIRVSLGGIRDEAEIRGHRRTYIGALPGRIIQGMKKAGSNNPIFMLDEIDKLGMDFRGDPSSALLEVLDPEQNDTFSDHYLEVPYDLSKVIFITTANQLDPVPPALKDRLEVMALAGYSEEEKLQIARKFLVPRQIEEHGLDKFDMEISDQAVQTVIGSYTKEAGVRNLEREIAGICRGIAREVAEGREDPARIEEKDLQAFLGAPKFYQEVAERTMQPGVATGLAWTPAGGDILFIEATRMPGKKELTLTGQLGDVMKESAQAALSYIRSKSSILGIDEDFFEKSDIHLHVPAGAIPKDGPSAGVTLFTALASLLTGVPVRNDVAMTGEITLRGLVLPVGGIKEKVLAARRAGIKTIIMPEKNRKDLDDIPENVRKEVEFLFVKEMDEVLRIALKTKLENGKVKKSRPDPRSGSESSIVN